VVAAFLLVELGTQHAVLETHIATKPSGGLTAATASATLRQHGVTAPCQLTSLTGSAFVALSEPVAYDLDCRYYWDLKSPTARGHERVIVLVKGTTAPDRWARSWPSYQLGDKIVAYVQPVGQ
jgi:hypothetical protein